MKTLSLLGSTGSIGTQTLDIVREHPKEFKIIGLTTNENITLLEKQISEFKPKAVSVMNEESADELKQKVKIPVYSAMFGLKKIATLEETNTVVNALVGSVGVIPTYEAIKKKKNIALANKETLVTAGQLIMNAAKKNKINIMPIDSEHSAIFQCLNGSKTEDVEKITLTCSGGPFQNYTKEQLEQAIVEDALKHPTWKMGNKITIDSATLMNKGFEILEAHFLYGIDYEKIGVVVHPQSIIHSMVEFKDHSTLAQLSLPDMKIPIQYALSYPKRLFNNSKRLDLAEIKNLSFEKVNHELFPCINFAYKAGSIGGTMPAVLNAANEIAVEAFLQRKINFMDIPRLIKRMMNQHTLIKEPTIDEIIKVDEEIKKTLSSTILK